MMSFAENPDDVAEDYRQALEDLSANSRIEIQNLTQIARENIKHAVVISKVLQNHIKKVAPARTLSALYVLDSIVKHVRTPYADFIGPTLYALFMGAYAKVDSSTRRKMEEMLRTWKEPIPGFMDTKPVFPPELIRPIEMALLGARNAAMAAHQTSIQDQQQLMRGGRVPPAAAPPPAPVPASAPYRHTPTPPPHMRPSSAQAGMRGRQPYPGPDGQLPYGGDHYASHSNGPTPIPPSAQRPHLAGPYGQPGPLLDAYGPLQSDQALDMDKVKDAIQQLAVVAQAEFAMAPWDPSKKSRLQALLDLERLIQNHRNVPQAQLLLVRDKVAELAVNMRASPNAAASYPATAAPAAAAPYPAAAASSAARAVAAPSAPPHVSIDSLFGQGAMASLLAGTRNVPAASANIPMPAAGSATTVAPTVLAPPPAPQLPLIIANALAAARATPPPRHPPQPRFVGSPAMRPAAPAIPAHPAGHSVPSAAATASSALPTDPSALLAMLRQSGLLQSTTPAQESSGTATALVNGHADGRVAQLKIYRPHLITKLYKDLGVACTQCGRRFQADQEDRRKKTAHMDWHFRVHQRIAEAEKRGQHRSWYVDEQDWANSRETVDSDYIAPQARFPGGGAGGTDAATDDMQLAPSAMSGPGGGGMNNNNSNNLQDQQDQHVGVGGPLGLQYIPVPDDDTNAACPVCQERFDSQWLDEAQEWVWMDAVRVGGRVYHASCYREVTRDGGGGGGGGAGTVGGGVGAAGGLAGGYARGTPEPVLGKRKAEDDYPPTRGKVKLESYY